MSTATPLTTTTAGTYRWDGASAAAPAPRPRRGRLRALLAGGLVLGVGSAATLAAWTDSEWVYGAGSGDGGVAASYFEVEQNVWDGLSGAANFVDREEQELAGGLSFSPLQATSLSPGDVVYAPMQLRTAARSAGASVTVGPAVDPVVRAAAVTAEGDLFAALRYSLRAGVAKADCGAAAFTSAAGTPLVTSSALTSGSSAGAVELAPATETAPGDPVDLCFAITLPGGSSESLMGASATPVWSFTSQSR